MLFLHFALFAFFLSSLLWEENLTDSCLSVCLTANKTRQQMHRWTRTPNELLSTKTKISWGAWHFSWVVSSINFEHWYTAPCPGQWVCAPLMTTHYQAQAQHLCFSWFHLIYWIWYLLIELKKQKFEFK